MIEFLGIYNKATWNKRKLYKYYEKCASDSNFGRKKQFPKCKSYSTEARFSTLKKSNLQRNVQEPNMMQLRPLRDKPKPYWAQLRPIKAGRAMPSRAELRLQSPVESSQVTHIEPNPIGIQPVQLMVHTGKSSIDQVETDLSKCELVSEFQIK